MNVKLLKFDLLPFTVLVFLFSILHVSIHAQDTSAKQTVAIISAYKPVYRDAVKMNFSAQPLPPFVDPVKYNYKLPVQPLALQLVPASLKAISLQQDSSLNLLNQDYVKIGYGNLRSPFAEAGIHFGQGKLFSGIITASHFSQEGKRRVQRFRFTDLKAAFSAQGDKHVLDGSFGYQRQVNWLYAIDSTLLLSKEDSLRKPYQTAEFLVNWRNKNAKETGFSYQPGLKAAFFNDGRNTEKNILLQIPASFFFGTDYALSLKGVIDLTFFDPSNKNAYINHIYTLNGALEVFKNNWQLKAGMMPLNTGNKFYLLPDFYGEYRISQEQLLVMAGWEGSVRKNNYENLVNINPWINQPDSQFNTRVTDLYVGLKGRILNNTLSFKFQFGLQQLRDQPLFENSKMPSVFEIRKEARINSLQTKAELHYRIDDRLQLQGSMLVNNFFGLQTESAPWHMIPLQVKAGITWKPLSRLVLNADCIAWRGGVFKRNIAGEKGRIPSVLDLNTGAEFRVNKRIFTWVQFSNLLNTEYQRWYQYPVFGFQVHGGIKLTFDAKL
jgi:hypothetical protein